MTEIVLNLVTYIQWEKPQVIEYDKICNGLKALSEILSIYSYIITRYSPRSISVVPVGYHIIFNDSIVNNNTQVYVIWKHHTTM